MRCVKMKRLKLLLFLVLAVLFSVSVFADKNIQGIGDRCDNGEVYGVCSNCLVCKFQTGLNYGLCEPASTSDRGKMALGKMPIPSHCCLVATSGGNTHNSDSKDTVSKCSVKEDSYGEIYVYSKGQETNWAKNNGLNLPKAYPYMTLASTPVHPLDKCTITNVKDYPPWKSSHEFNYGCYNLVPCKDSTRDTHLTLIKIHPGQTGTGINPEYFDGIERDVCNCGGADIYRSLQFNGIQSSDGKSVGTTSKIFTGSELEVMEPEFVDWTGASEVTYPFVFTSKENWEINVSLYVDPGLEIVSEDSAGFLVANESKILQFRVREKVPGTGAGLGAAVVLDVSHAGKEQNNVSIISSAAVKDSTVKMQIKPVNGTVQNSESTIGSIKEKPVSGEFLMFAGVALLIIIAIGLYVSLNQKK
jgi:hypothetical protein